MLELFTYKTPSKFAQPFKDFYSVANVRQIKFLSLLIFIIAFFTRVLGTIFHKEVLLIKSYDEHSLGNWIQLAGSCIFYILSTISYDSSKWSNRQRKLLTLSFILFILIATFWISYVVSLHNTKNTLTMFLIGIVSVSLFFAIEYREIVLISIFIFFIFMLGMVTGQHSFGDQIMNTVAAVIMSFILLSFSRYSYYFKSIHFVKLKQLEEKNAEIERLNNQKGEILGFVAHDLRNPLNNIEALSNLILADNEDKVEVKMIANAANQAKEIINDLMEAVKVEKAEMTTQKLNINLILQHVTDKWITNTKRSITYSKSDEEIYCEVNPSKLERVIDNLIGNALKFSAAEQPVEVAIKKLLNTAEIKIKDYGIGIPTDMKAIIFEQFTPAGRKGLQGEKSIGLGLHISKKIVEQHKGKLFVESKEAEGTQFCIVLPIVSSIG